MTPGTPGDGIATTGQQADPLDRAFRADLIDAMLRWSGLDRPDADQCAKELATVLDRHPQVQTAPGPEREALEDIARGAQGSIDTSLPFDRDWVVSRAMEGLGWLPEGSPKALPTGLAEARRLSIAIAALREISEARDEDGAARALQAIKDTGDIELAVPEPEPDVRPRADGLRGLDITCGSCGEDYGTNVTDLDEIECVECDARRCPNCRHWFGGTS